MARVPTWSELRQDALRIAQTQKECYHDVHDLLDNAIPELDRKLAQLLNKDYPHTTEPTRATTTKTRTPEPAYDYIEPREIQREKAQSPTAQEACNAFATSANIDFNSMEVEYDGTRLTADSAIPVYNSIGSSSLTDTGSYNDNDTESDCPITHNKVPSRPQKDRQKFDDELIELRRLALPMPISEYLKINRPGVVRRAESRTMYIRRRKTERKKASSSARIITGFQRIRLSSDNMSEKPKKILRNYAMPNYQVECKLSEHEMKRLTAKVYRRLPEVVRRKHDEVNNYLKIQNYKNKKEYGRKLLENRRHGIINYPLRIGYDNRSLDSGHDDSLSSGERAADSLKSDPYY